ncbi:MAG: hypothetical protein ABIP65_00155 [Vicinamibacterales bacterium]
MEANSHDFLLCNYANADMVGHTGVLSAVICDDRYRTTPRPTLTGQRRPGGLPARPATPPRHARSMRPAVAHPD